MFYYQFNIGDYAAATKGLSLLEDLAYRRVLDLYYTTEQPLNECLTDVAREIGMRDQQQEVDYVVQKYFTLTADGWSQKRAEREVEAYQSKQKSASKAGKASAEARRIKASEQTSSDRSTTVQPNVKHKTLNTKQEPVTTVKPEPKVPSCQVEKIIESYKAVARKLPDVRVVDEGTKGNIRARWRQDSRFQSIDFWQTFFSYCEENTFLSGQSEPKDGRTPFRATLAWLVKPANFAKVVNGDYDR